MDQIKAADQKHDSSVDETLRTELILAPKSHGCDVAKLISALTKTIDDAQTFGLLLAIGNYELDDLPPERRKQCLQEVRKRLAQASSAGIRSAAEWCLSRWNQRAMIAAEKGQKTASPDPHAKVYVDLNGQTMHVFDRKDSQLPFLMGCPLSEAGAFWEDRFHCKRIPRTFAMSSTEVTIEHFRAFLKAKPSITYLGDRIGAGNIPATKTTWFLVALYCNWLSELHGIPESEWCFQVNYINDEAPKIHLSPDYLTKTGYRLPSEAEWEFCCRGETETAYPFGETNDRLRHFAWYDANSNGHVHPVGLLMPNRFGMFDMLGNVHEWCMERHESDLTRNRSFVNTDHEDQYLVERSTFRLIRGGSFNSQALSARSGSRQPLHGYKRRSTQGFRVARTLATHEH